MSKNLTRKGLALGALVALGSSVLAGAPAQAAGETITLASSYGTGTKTVLGSTFDLASTLVGFSAAPNLTYEITGVTANKITGAAVRTSTDQTGAFDALSANPADVTSPTSVKAVYASTSEVEALGNYHELRFGLDTSLVSATTTVNVTVFDDSVVADGKWTTGEAKSASVPVTFVKPSEVTATTTLAKPVIGASTAKISVTLGDINLQQVTAGVVRVALTKNGVASSTASSTADAAWSKDDAALVKSLSTGGVTSSDVFSAQAYLADLTGGTYSKSGSATSVVSADAAGYDVIVGDTTAVSSAQVTSTSGNAAFIRSGSTSVAFKSEITAEYAAVATSAAPAGIPAKVVISGSSDLGTTTLTVGGKTIKLNGDAITVTTVTDAAGLVNFTVAADNAKDGEGFTAQVSVLDKSAGDYISNSLVTYNYADAVETKFVVDVAGNSVFSTAKAGTVSFDVAVYDQFKQPFSSTDGFKAFVTSTNVTSGAAVSNETTITAGKGTVSVVDNSTTTGSYSLSVRLKEWNKTTNLWDENIVATGGTAHTAKIVDVYVVSANAVASLTGTLAAGTLAIDTVDFKDANTATGASAPSVVNLHTVSGKALAADGSAVAGVPVTLTAAGVQFVAGTFYKVGAITVRTNAAGEYSAQYTTHLKGKASIVVTSGAATKTVEGADVATPSTTASIKSVVVTGSTTLLPGRSVIYTVALVDKFGNPVETSGSVRVSYTGPGYFTTDLSGITAFGSKGTLSLTLITGATDSGAGTLTVTSYGVDNVSSADADKKDNVVVATTITVAAAPAPAVVEPTSKIGTANGRVYVNVKDAKGAVVSVKIGAKWFTKSALNNDYTFSFKNKKGKKVSVKVYVDGDLSSSKTITVK